MASENFIRLQELYALIPKFTCKSGCTDCCGPVPFSKTEWDQVHVKKVGKKCLTCPYAMNGSCEIYEDRPFICRLYGTVEDLRCPHGCRPEHVLTASEGRHLIAEYMKIVESEGSHLAAPKILRQ